MGEGERLQFHVKQWLHKSSVNCILECTNIFQFNVSKLDIKTEIVNSISLILPLLGKKKTTPKTNKQENRVF